MIRAHIAVEAIEAPELAVATPRPSAATLLMARFAGIAGLRTAAGLAYSRVAHRCHLDSFHSKQLWALGTLCITLDSNPKRTKVARTACKTQILVHPSFANSLWIGHLVSRGW
jgi:hypothetical protein